MSRLISSAVRFLGGSLTAALAFGCFARGPIYLRSVKRIQAPWTYVHIVFLVVFVFTEPV